MKSKYRYEELSWPEIREAITQQPVVLLPFGTIEDHGLHLPLNTDNVIVEAICEETARRAAREALRLPLVSYGLDEHHMDFPGTLTVDMLTLVQYVSDVAISVARHGFTHILIVNGHGSNAPIADLAARRVVIETGAVCGAMSPNAAIDPTLAEPTLYNCAAPSRAGSRTLASLRPRSCCTCGRTWSRWTRRSKSWDRFALRTLTGTCPNPRS